MKKLVILLVVLVSGFMAFGLDTEAGMSLELGKNSLTFENASEGEFYLEQVLNLKVGVVDFVNTNLIIFGGENETYVNTPVDVLHEVGVNVDVSIFTIGYYITKDMDDKIYDKAFVKVDFRL